MTDQITEKVYCYDHPSAYNNNNHDALAIAAMCNNRNNDMWPMLAMMNGGFGANEWMNNPFAYMVMLALFGSWGGGFGFGNRGGSALQDSEIQAKLNSISAELQTNQNTTLLMDAVKGNATSIQQLASNLNCDFNTLQSAICSVQSAIQQVGNQVGLSGQQVINAVQMGNCNIIQALNNCCCQTQRQIADFRADVQLQNCQQTSELRNGQRDLGQAITTGFSQVAFQAQQDKCDIIRAGQDNTQRIVDTLNNHWSNEKDLKIQDLKFELSQERQNNLLINRLSNNCGCNCGNSCCGCGL